MQETINGNEYRIGKLDTLQQFHLSRKLAPVIVTLAPVFPAVQALKDKDLGIEQLPELAEAVKPMLDALSEMSNEDSEYVIGLCMSVVLRQQDSKWFPVWNEKARRTQYEDVDMVAMLRIVVAVIWENLGSFIQGLLDKLPAAESPKAA